MRSVLKDILDKTRKDLKERRKKRALFKNAILNPKHGNMAIIAEIKLASPTNPNLGSKEDLLKKAKEYERGGTDVISVITEKHYFKGELEFIPLVKEMTSLPILQKDFIIDLFQVQEAKNLGSDAILLIAQIVSKDELIELVDLSTKLGIEPVVEINSKEDLNKALDTSCSIIAVNARDLDTFTIDVDRACSLLNKIPQGFIKLGFSGIKSQLEVNKYKKAGAQGVLVGTNLMKSSNTEGFLSSLRV